MESNLNYTYFYPRVLQAVPTNDYKIYAYFNDGSVRLFDMKPLIEKGGVFEPLFDIDVFKSKITIMDGVVAWDFEGNRDPYKCVDIDPLDMFRTTEVIPDPLEIKCKTDGNI